MSEDHIHNLAKYDPTHTTVLRNTAVRESNRRFNNLIKVIKKAIIEDDVFGLNPLVTYDSPGKKAYEFLTDSQKVEQFMKWLNTQIDNEILSFSDFSRLSITQQRTWIERYVQEAYKRGISRADIELKKAGYTISPIKLLGGIASVIELPAHADRLGMLYFRAFNELSGVTKQMEQIISKILMDGLLEGKNPRVIARQLVAAIDGKGLGTLGIFDKLGRFIPAKRRAEILARTEIIRSHHLATIQEYKTWGAYGVTVMAEFKTAGDDRVCELCDSLEGKVYTLDEIETMIPVHPQCRCIALPIVKSKNEGGE